MAKKKTDMIRHQVFVFPKDWAELEKLAEIKGATVSFMVREAIVEFLEKRREK
jgi:hypothetical protein